MRVNSAIGEHRGGGNVHRRHQNEVPRGGNSTAYSCSPMPSAKALRPNTKTGTSAPSRSASSCRSCARQAELPQPVQREQRGRRIRAAAAQSAAHRQPLGQRDLDAEAASRFLLQQPRRAHREIASSPAPRPADRCGRSRRRRAARKLSVSPKSMKRNKRLQQVVAVGAPAGDSRNRLSLAGRSADQRRASSDGRSSLRRHDLPLIDHQAHAQPLARQIELRGQTASRRPAPSRGSPPAMRPAVICFGRPSASSSPLDAIERRPRQAPHPVLQAVEREVPAEHARARAR